LLAFFFILVTVKDCPRGTLESAGVKLFSEILFPDIRLASKTHIRKYKVTDVA